MRRVNLWPEHLFEFLERAEELEYSDTYFCANFASDAVLAMTEFDPMEPYRGLTQAQAEAAVKADHGSLRKYLKALFGDPVPVAFARRGDVVMRGEALGICCGRESAFISSEGGVAYWPTLEGVRAWHV